MLALGAEWSSCLLCQLGSLVQRRTLGHPQGAWPSGDCFQAVFIDSLNRRSFKGSGDAAQPLVASELYEVCRRYRSREKEKKGKKDE